MIALLLALLADPGWETVHRCYEPSFAPNRCDVRAHPHLSDIGLSGQLGCDTLLPQFGAIGTTLLINVHRNRCQKVGAVITPGSPVIVYAGLSFVDPSVFTPGLGWVFVDQVVAQRMDTANAQGVATVQFQIPNDPALVGLELYFQAFVNDAGVYRESTGGRLELW